MIPDKQNMLSRSLKTIFIVFDIKNIQYFYKGQEDVQQFSN